MPCAFATPVATERTRIPTRPSARLDQANRARSNSDLSRGRRIGHSDVTAFSPRAIHQPTEHPVQTFFAQAEHSAQLHLTRTDRSGSAERAGSNDGCSVLFGQNHERKATERSANLRRPRHCEALTVNELVRTIILPFCKGDCRGRLQIP